MQLFWLKQRSCAVPPGDQWLSPRERERLLTLRLPKRRADFLLGRFTAKQAVAAYLGAGQAPALAEIEIRAEPSGAPAVFLAGSPAPLSLSLSHRDGHALCAVAEPETLLGCDLEVIEDHGSAFLSDFFTAEEQALLWAAPSAKRTELCTVLWSAKESALKALKTGLRLDTREVIVTLLQGAASVDGWCPLGVRHAGSAARFPGFYRVEPPLVLVLVSAPGADALLPLAGRPAQPSCQPWDALGDRRS